MFKPTVLFVIAIMITSYLSAQSQWRWINPLPSGAASLQVRFTDDKNGFIFNSNAELIRTKNTGATWQIVDSFPGMVCFDIKGSTGIMGGWGGRFYISRDKGSTWEPKISNTTGGFSNVSMVSDEVFFFYSGNDNKIFKTLDGGNTWQTLVCEGTVERVFFVTPDIGYVAIRNDILKTVDGGITWISTSKVHVIPSNITSMFFLNENTGYAYREHNAMMSTTDGGKTWKTTNLSDQINSIYFTDFNTGYASGEHGALYRTTDAGNSWEWIGISARIYAYDLNSIYFLSNTTGFAVGHRGRILKTTDGGNSWQPYAFTYDAIGSLEFPSNDVAYAIAGRNIWKTRDKGVSWKSVSNFEIHTYSSFDKSHFVNENTGFVTTDEYVKLYRTTNGGVSWTEVSPNYYEYSRVTDMEFLTPEIGYMALYGSIFSVIIKTTDGGATWQEIWKGDYMGVRFSRIDYVSETSAFALGYNAVYKTTDNFKSWQKVFEIDYGSLKDVYFINSQKGFAYGDQGLMYMTVDGGNTWVPVEQNWSDVYPYDISEIKFFNEEIGYLRMGEGGTLFKTTDGGYTWNKDGNYGGGVITFGKDSTIYIAGGNGFLIAGTVKASGLFSFTNLTNNKCTVTFSIKEKKSVPAVNDIWLQVMDAYGNKQLIRMVNNPASENTNEREYTATVSGLVPGQTYTARAEYSFENITGFYGNVKFMSEGFMQPFVTIDRNGTTLSSSIEAPTEWYLNHTLIPGVSSTQIQPTENGVYSTRINDAGCMSEMSIPLLYIKENMGVSISPNPANSFITITNSRLRALDIKIFDINGVLVFSTPLTQLYQSIPLLDFRPGVYTIWAYDKQENIGVRLRFLKQ